MKMINLSGHQNAYLAELGFEFPGALHVDLADPDLFNKIVAFLQNIGVGSEDVVTVALPGLAPLSMLVVAAIHGLTGTFPVVQTLIRGENGFVPGPCWNVQDMRNSVARKSRENVVLL